MQLCKSIISSFAEFCFCPPKGSPGSIRSDAGGPADVLLLPLLASCPFDVLVATLKMKNACERRNKESLRGSSLLIKASHISCKLTHFDVSSERGFKNK